MLFEVPYNFDESLIKFYSKNRSYISYLYLPPYKDDSDNTRTFIQTSTLGHCYMPKTREEYESHLHKIRKSGLNFVVLWQKKEHLLTSAVIDYYCNLNIAGFIVADDENAKIIRTYRPNLIVTCSIVQKSCDGISTRDLSLYDYVILYYPFNRGLDALKKLGHIKSKIILMPNTCCDIECPSTHHWFPSKNRPFVPQRDCSMNLKNISRCGMILPQHLYLFDNYVGGYKLQGREWPTEVIKYLCHFYFYRTEYSDFIDPFFKKEMSKQLLNIINNVEPSEYYNTKTSDLLNRI